MSKLCKKCDGPLTETQRKFCCNKCKQAYHRQKQQKHEIAECVICLKPFIRKSSLYVTCGLPECIKKRKEQKSDEKNEARKIKRPCQVCGKDASRKYCNDECRKISRRTKRKKCICLNCGKVDYRRIRKKYCSNQCESSVHCRSRRARKKKAFVENVYLKDVVEKNNSICQICLKPVDLSLPYPHPLSASIDHIHPLSKGGKHSLANTQLAHFYCNTCKGAIT